MPYYRCPSCGLTTHSVAGRFTANICPNCAAPLQGADRVHLQERRQPVIRRRFVAEPDSAAAARRELETLSWSLEEQESWVLALLVTELITNSVMHASAEGGVVVLEVDVRDDVIRVRVRDDGRGFVAPLRSAKSPLNSHWGLYLVDELADRWEVGAEPTTVVSFELDRAPAVTSETTDADDGDRLRRALSEHARLGDAYQQSVGTTAELSSFSRLQRARREVTAAGAVEQRATES